MTPREHLALFDAEVRAFCEGHHIRRLGQFGSIPRGDFSPSSDVGLSAEFQPEPVPDLQRLAATGGE